MRICLVSEGDHELGGALQALINRLTGQEHAFEPRKWREIQAVHFPDKKGRSGHFRRFIAWMMNAKESGFDALVLVVDEDGDRQRNDDAVRAQEYLQSWVIKRRAVGVAIRAFDAWMLADEKALTKVAGDAVGRQGNPEKVSDPKTTLGRLFQDNPTRGDYRQISAMMDLSILEKRCPRGFAPFAKRVCAMVAEPSK